MKSMIEKVFSIKALLSLLLVFATTSAWAAVPVPTVVWESDFSTTVSKTGRDGNDYKISELNGLSINGDGNLVVDTANAQGALIDLPDGGKTAATVLIKYSNLTAETTGNATLANFGVTSNGSSYYYIGSRSTSSGQLTLTPYYESSTYPINNATYGSGTVPSMQTGSGYLVFAYDSFFATHTYTGSSLSSLSGGYNSQLRWGSYKVGKIYIGGGQNKGKAYCWKGSSGTIIEKVAIFLGNAYTNTQLADYRWPSEIKAVLPERDMINLNISNADSYAITGSGVDTISTLAGEMLDNAWQNTPSGNAVVSGDARNGRVTGVTAYDGTSKEATTLSDVTFTWAVEGSGTANYGNVDIENNPTFHKAWLARLSKQAETSSILVQSIPYRKYDIIVYCFGADDSAFNPVFVNGVPYVGDTSLATDTNTRKATSSSETWGGRRASPSLGQTAIMLKGLENPELSLTIRSGASSICAVQILRDMSEGVWPTSKKVISLNLMSAYSSSGTTPAVYGLEPVPNEAWTKDGLSEGSSFDKDVAVTIKEWNGSTTVDTSVTLHEKGGNGYAWSGYNYTPQSQFLTGYIDDTSQQQSVTVGDIPYACYDVIVYCATDNGDKQFGPVTVNGTSYRWDDDKQCAVIASSGSSTAETRWGATRSRLPAYGRNAIRIPDQTASTLTITGGDNANNARGGIAAIQIVEAYSGLKVYSNGSWSGGTEPTSGDAVIVLDGDTSLTIDGTASLGTVTITGNGTLTLSGSGQFTATTVDVESLATVNANPDRLGATTYVGSGTVVYSGRAPEAGKGWSDSANWTGTLEIKDYTTSLGNFHLATYGNSKSKVCLNNATGYLYSTANSGAHDIKELVIGDGGFTQNGSYSVDNTFVVPCKVTGSGEYTFSATGSGQKTLFLSGDIAEFAGKITIGGENNRVVIGSSTDRSFVDQSLIVCSGKSLTVRKQWGYNGFSGGIFVDANGLLEVASTGFLPASGGFTIDGVLKTAGLNYNSLGHIAESATYTAAHVLINDTGVLELTSSGDTKEANDAAYLADYSTVTGTGTLKFSSSSGWRTFPDAQARLPPTTLTVQIELAGGLIITMNDETAIGNLAGSKNIRSDWDAYHKTLTVTQSKDTTWEGKFTNNRIDTFKVTGSGGTLTLTGTHDISIAAQIESTGKVNLTGTWLGAATVSGTFGGTGTLTGNLTFNAGSTFKAFASDENGLSVSGTVSYPESGTVTVDVDALGSPESDVVLISKSGLDETKFALKSGSPVGYALKVEGDALKLKANATVAITVPTVANTTVTVTANGTPVEGDNGVYTVPYGSAVVVTYAAVSGYQISGTATYNIASAEGDETLTIDEDLSSDLIVATFNGTSYTTLQAAVNAWVAAGMAQAMNPVTLIGNTTVAGLTISAHNTGMPIPMQLIGGGYTLTGPVTIAAGATLQPLNITLAGNLTVNGTLVVPTTLSVGGTVTFADGSGITVTTLSASEAKLAATGSVTVEGDLLVYLQSNSLEAGTYLLATGASVDADDAVATVQLNGMEDPAWTFSATETSLVLKAVAAEVEGVKYETFADAVDAADGVKTITLLANASYTLSVGETLIVAAGSFTMTVTAPAGYAVSQSGSGVVTYTTQKYVAKLRNPNVGSTTYADEVYYTSLAAAVADVVEQTMAIYADYVATVTLLDDITLDATVTVSKKMKLDLNGKTLTASGINAINNSTKLAVQGSSGSINVTSGSSVVLTAAAATLTVGNDVTVSAPTTSLDYYEVVESDGTYRVRKLAEASTESVAGVGEVEVITPEEGVTSITVPDSVTGKVAIPGTVTNITGIEAGNLLLKVAYNDGSAQTAYYTNVLAVAGGVVSLDGTKKVTIGGVDVSVEPEVNTASSPMTLSDTTPGFTVKTIPGLFYVAETCSTPNGTFTNAGTPQQATSDSTTLSTNNDSWGENEKVKYYRIKVSTTGN